MSKAPQSARPWTASLIGSGRHRRTSAGGAPSARLSQMLARIVSIGCALALFVGVIHAQPPAPEPADPRAQIASKIPGVRADDLRPTPVSGIYELTR